MDELARTRICSPDPAPSQTETTRVLELAAAPNTGGVLPVTAKSIRPAFSASICGGPEVKVENTTRYGRLSRALAARSSASVPPFWSPMCKITPDSCDNGTAGGTPLGCGPTDRDTQPDTAAASTSTMATGKAV